MADRMNENSPEWVDVSQLRLGLFIELDLGWMAHPFPSSRFKISSVKQIAAIRDLGVKRVRFLSAKSDPDAVASTDWLPSPSMGQTSDPLPVQAIDAGFKETRQRQLRVMTLEEQKQSLIACERMFAEAARQSKRVMDQVLTEPQMAADQCRALIRGYVDDMSCDGEIAIRLLSQNMGGSANTHPVNVTVLCLLLGRALGLSQNEMCDLGVAATLHDMGKLELPTRVHEFEADFSPFDLKHYQSHVDLGVLMAERMALSEAARIAIAQHHELEDGSGFPLRAKGGQIGLLSKILVLVNRYENLCNHGRPEKAITPHEALALIFAQLRSQFDEKVLNSFIRMMGIYPPGSIIEFLDGRHALVVSVNSSRPLRPRVIVYDPLTPKSEALILDLEQASEVNIRRSLKPSSLSSAAWDYFLPRKRICYFFERSIDPTLLREEK